MTQSSLKPIVKESPFAVKGSLDKFQEELLAAIRDVANRWNVDVNFGGVGDFTPSSCSFYLHAAERSQGDLTEEREAFHEFCSAYHLSPDRLNQEVRIGADAYTLVGMRPANRCRPFCLLRDSDKQLFEAPPSVIYYGLVSDKG